ncbi:MAG: hypothetical protein Q8J62_03650 [Candidatus Cloacimonadaceae bacterium]|nr:hypothetical protein [Candidatus Cloacimonadaceae bacterium]
MPRSLILVSALILIMFLVGCAKRNTAYNDEVLVTLDTIFPVVGNPLDLSFDANNIYVALDQGGISIINPTTSENRWYTKLISRDGTTTNFMNIRKIAVVGEFNRLFLNEVGSTDLIHIVDISEMDSLDIMDSITGASQDIQDMKFLKILNPTGADVIELIYSSGRNVHYGRYNANLWMGSTFSFLSPVPASGVDLNDTHIFVAGQQRGLFIYNRSNQQLISEVVVPGQALKVKVVGNYAYIASREGGLNIVNIANPAAPVRVGGFNTTGYATSIDVSGDLAVVSSGSGSVYLFDISDPSNPVMKQRLIAAGYTNNAKFNGSKVIVASRDMGIMVYNLDAERTANY